jgi:16S rRNA (guanine527-N7)-methyltransferase
VTHALAPALSQGLSGLGLDVDPDKQQQLLVYLDLLSKWNKVYNLTAVRESQHMLTQHLLDCLAVMSPLRQRLPQLATVMDVGAGGGLPSVVLAICRPDLRVTAVDTVAKKAAFIQTAAHALGLSQLQGVHARVEDLVGPFDLITSRAFSSLADFVQGSRQALAPGGVWMAMKGKQPAEELAALPEDVVLEQVQTLQVPGLDAERCLVWMTLRQVGPCPAPLLR